MPNALADREIAREFLQDAATGEAIGAEMLRLLRDQAARDRLQGELAEVIASLGTRGAAQRAAMAIAETLQLPA
jgi:lipid-A-disaccharide synthase